MKMSGKKSINPDDVRKTLYLIDCYRVHLFYDINWIDRKVEEGTLGREFASSWKNLRKRMIKMASVTSHIPGVRRLVKIQSTFESLWQIALPLIIVITFANIFAPQTFSIIKIVTPFLAILAFSSILLSLFARSFLGGRIGKKIEQHFKNNPEAQEIAGQEIKQSVQMLIEELRKFLKETNQEPKKHLIGINFFDYDHIKIVKKPKPWRRYYLAEVTK